MLGKCDDNVNHDYKKDKVDDDILARLWLWLAPHFYGSVNLPKDPEEGPFYTHLYGTGEQVVVGGGQISSDQFNISTLHAQRN